MGKSCGKISWEILAGKSCGKWRQGKNQFKKGRAWWKFSILEYGDGEPTNQDPAQENLAQENLAQENLVEKSCGKILQEILVGKSCRKWRRGKSQFKKVSDWWKFSICNRVMGANQSGSSLGKSCGKFLRKNLVGIGVGEKANLRNSCRKILREIVAGNSCRKILQENLAGKSCGKILREILVGKSCGKSWGKISWKILQEILQENLAGNLMENLAGNSCGKIL